MPKAPINGIDLYYEECGEGPAIAFAHGAGGNHMSWWQQVPLFSQHYRCITFDHRGFGQSLDAPEGPGRKAFVDDLAGLLDHLGIEQTFLVAQSMGGLTCLGLALAQPHRVKGLVMADTAGGIAEESVLKASQEWRERTNLTSQNLLTRVMAPGLQQRNPSLAFLYSQITALNPPRPELPRPGRGEGPTAPELAKLPVHVLFIVGSEDVISPPHVIREAHKLIPGSQLAIVPEAGHSVYFEKPDVFNYLLSSFFDEVGK